jgi:hypothetical protein
METRAIELPDYTWEHDRVFAPCMANFEVIGIDTKKPP